MRFVARVRRREAPSIELRLGSEFLAPIGGFGAKPSIKVFSRGGGQSPQKICQDFMLILDPESPL